MSDAKAKKRQDDIHIKIIQELLSLPENQACADCGAKGPKWASVNIGCFLCIRCGGLHRKMGTHISKIKSTTLDSWSPEQIQFVRSMGNDKVNAAYLGRGNSPSVNFQQSDSDMEVFIRNKYEKRLYSLQASSSAYQQPALNQASSNVANKRTSFQPKASHANQLRQMGFNDPEQIGSALMIAGDNIEQAINLLLEWNQASKAPASVPAPASIQRYQEPQIARNSANNDLIGDIFSDSAAAPQQTYQNNVPFQPFNTNNQVDIFNQKISYSDQNQFAPVHNPFTGTQPQQQLVYGQSSQESRNYVAETTAPNPPSKAKDSIMSLYGKTDQSNYGMSAAQNNPFAMPNMLAMNQPQFGMQNNMSFNNNQFGMQNMATQNQNPFAVQTMIPPNQNTFGNNQYAPIPVSNQGYGLMDVR